MSDTGRSEPEQEPVARPVWSPTQGAPVEPPRPAVLPPAPAPGLAPRPAAPAGPPVAPAPARPPLSPYGGAGTTSWGAAGIAASGPLGAANGDGAPAAAAGAPDPARPGDAAGGSLWPTPAGGAAPGGDGSGAGGSSGDGSTGGGGSAGGQGAGPSRPRWLVPLIVVAAVLVVAAVVVAIVTSRGGDSDVAPTPLPTQTVVLPSPTPTVPAAARAATTAFAQVLPASVLQYALATSVPNDEWVTAGAIEAYTDTYTDGGSGTVTVLAGQFETPDAATAFAQTLTAALPAATAGAAASPSPSLPQSGDVMVDGAKAGTFTIVDAGDGTGVAVWTNGTAVFRATAPVADIADVYAAYSL